MAFSNSLHCALSNMLKNPEHKAKINFIKSMIEEQTDEQIQLVIFGAGQKNARDQKDIDIIKQAKESISKSPELEDFINTEGVQACLAADYNSKLDLHIALITRRLESTLDCKFDGVTTYSDTQLASSFAKQLKLNTFKSLPHQNQQYILKSHTL